MTKTRDKQAESALKKKQREAKKAYIQRKKAATEREKTNFDKIILFRSDDEWWKIIGRSVIYYKHIVGPRTGVERKISEDTDFDFPSSTGVISIKDPDGFFKLCLERGEFKESEKGNDDFRALMLSNKVSDEAYNKMVDVDDKDWEMAEGMVLPRVIWPELKVKVERLAREVREATRTFPKDLGASLGTRMSDYALDMAEAQNRAAKGFVEPLEALEAMREALGGLGGDMFVVVHLRCLRMARIQRIAELLVRLEKLVEIEFKKAMKVASEKDLVELYEPETAEENTARLNELVKVAATPDPRTPHGVVAKQNQLKKLSQPVKRKAK